MIAHWNGRALDVVRPFKKGHLEAVAATGPNDVWAVGIRGNNPVVTHWDGRRWALTDTPVANAPIAADAREGYLFDVVAFSRRDAWAVGRHNDMPLVLHWNGKKWRTVPVNGDWPAETELYGVDGASSRDLWAVGTADYGQRPVAVHWDGRSWREEASFYPASVQSDSIELDRIEVSSPNDIWTLESTTDYSVALHWDGSQQHVIPIPTSISLDDIAPISASNMVGVGWEEYDVTYPDVARWDGKRWIRQKTPLDNLRNTTLEGLYQVSPNDIWAVGAHLIARYTCSKA